MTFDWKLVEAMQAERRALREEARAAIAEAQRMRMRLRATVETIRVARATHVGGEDQLSRLRGRTEIGSSEDSLPDSSAQK